MFESVLFLLIVSGLAWGLYLWQRHTSPRGEPSPPKTEPTEPRHPGPPPPDDFLAGIQAYAAAKAEEVKSAVQSQEKELEAKYGEDLKLKRRLADFAKQHKLDRALISLWEEVRYYPERSKLENFGQWNKLKVTDCDGYKKHEDREDVEGVSFILSGIRYEVVQTESRFDDDTFADFALSENGALVFGIKTSVDYDFAGANYECFDVFAFKKSGNWARMLLDVWAMRETESGKSGSEWGRYFRADEIKGKFQE